MRRVKRGMGLLALAAAAMAAPIAGAGEVGAVGPQTDQAIRDGFTASAYSVTSLDLPVDNPEQVMINVPIAGAEYTLVLHRRSLRAADYVARVQLEDGSIVEIDAPPVRTYRGTVAEIPGSVVAASIINGTLTAQIIPDFGTDWVIQPVSEVDSSVADDVHVVYNVADTTPNESWKCGTADIVQPPQDHQNFGGGGFTPRGGCDYICEIAFDADVEFYNRNGGSVANTIADIENIMNGVENIYSRDVGIGYVITNTLVRTSEPDPYSSSNSGTLLTQFRNHWNSSQGGIQRDVAHLMTGKNINGGVIGIAYLSVICNLGSAYGLSESRFTGAYNSRVALTAHELGHNWSADHCDSSNPCYIMCSGLGGCGAITLFAPVSINQIVSFRNSRGCLDQGSGGAPVAVDDSVSTPFDQNVIIDVLANDTIECGGASIELDAVFTANGGFLTLVNGESEVQYTTPFNISGTPYFGDDTFDYSIEAGGQTSNDATVTVTLTGDGGGGDRYLMSFRTNTTIPGVGTVRNDDIVAYDPSNGSWELIFDGSDVGLGPTTFDAFTVIDGTSGPEFLFSITLPTTIPAVQDPPNTGITDDSDIVRFVPTSLGENTSGDLHFHFDGSDVQMTLDREDIDGLAVGNFGEILMTTTGTTIALTLEAKDEDILAFNATQFGRQTTGFFDFYFDGSDVGYTKKFNQIDAIHSRDDGVLYFSTQGNFDLIGPTLSGADEDIIEFNPTSLGNNTTGTSSIVLDLSTLISTDDLWTITASDIDFLSMFPARYDGNMPQQYPNATPICPGDFDDNDVADTRDVVAFMNAYAASEPIADVNEDSFVNTADVVFFLDAFAQPCGQDVPDND